jgi:hypothetical protein
MHVNEDGIWYEAETPAVLQGPLTAETLGGAVVTAMRATARRSRDLRAQKFSDRPSYRASGSTSVRTFEQEFISLSVDGANDANVVAVVTGAPEKDGGMTGSCGSWSP